MSKPEKTEKTKLKNKGEAFKVGSESTDSYGFRTGYEGTPQSFYQPDAGSDAFRQLMNKGMPNYMANDYTQMGGYMTHEQIMQYHQMAMYGQNPELMGYQAYGDMYGQPQQEEVSQEIIIKDLNDKKQVEAASRLLTGGMSKQVDEPPRRQPEHSGAQQPPQKDQKQTQQHSRTTDIEDDQRYQGQSRAYKDESGYDKKASNRREDKGNKYDKGDRRDRDYPEQNERRDRGREEPSSKGRPQHEARRENEGINKKKDKEDYGRDQRGYDYDTGDYQYRDESNYKYDSRSGYEDKKYSGDRREAGREDDYRRDYAYEDYSYKDRKDYDRDYPSKQSNYERGYDKQNYEEQDDDDYYDYHARDDVYKDKRDDKRSKDDNYSKKNRETSNERYEKRQQDTGKGAKKKQPVKVEPQPPAKSSQVYYQRIDNSENVSTTASHHQSYTQSASTNQYSGKSHRRDSYERDDEDFESFDEYKPKRGDNRRDSPQYNEKPPKKSKGAHQDYPKGRDDNQRDRDDRGDRRDKEYRPKEDKEYRPKDDKRGGDKYENQERNSKREDKYEKPAKNDEGDKFKEKRERQSDPQGRPDRPEDLVFKKDKKPKEKQGPKDQSMSSFQGGKRNDMARKIEEELMADEITYNDDMDHYEPQYVKETHANYSDEVVALMIAEKPSIAMSIAKALSGGNFTQRKGRSPTCPVYQYRGSMKGHKKVLFKVTSVAGHVYSRDFPKQYADWQRTDPMDLFEAETVLVEANPKNRIVDHVKQEAKDVSYLVLWLDNDREGENICFEILTQVMPLMRKQDSFKQVYRAVFSSLAPQDLIESFRKLEKGPNRNESLSVDARQIIDLKVGVVFSRFQSLYFGDKFPKLRDYKTPTIGFCVQRVLDIEKFKPEKYYAVIANVKIGGREYQIPYTEERRMKMPEAEKAKRELEVSAQGTVKSVETTEKKKGRPEGLNTVEMLKHASVHLNMGPADTMHVAERLYLSGYMTYPRTESTSYPTNFDFKSIIDKLKDYKDDASVRSFAAKLVINKPKKGVDVGDHPPITPTTKIPSELGWAEEK